MQHHFDIEHATKYGVEEAIVINCFQFWIGHNMANGRHQHDGRTWTYNSVRALADLFPYWTPKQVRRIMESLENQAVLMTGNYNVKNYDKTTWYAFIKETEFIGQKSLCPNGQTELPKRAKGSAQMGKPIPVNNTVNNQLSHTQSENAETEKPTLPTSYEPAYNHLIEHLKANAFLIDGLKNRSGFSGSIAPIIRAYLRKMQENGEWYQLRVPVSPEENQRWVSKVLAGVEGWAEVRKNRKQPTPPNQTGTTYTPPAKVYQPIR